MIAIIAEKPNIGKDIARIVGATRKYEGYVAGNGYMVTWAYGQLVALATPSEYGYRRITKERIPIIPDPFRLTIHQKRAAKGFVNDTSTTKQLKVIKEVFNKCDSIIVATDPSGAGELLFRDIYTYLGCKKPFKRLWLNSLTDNFIKLQMQNLQESKRFDNLYYAADCRAKADWLIGVNTNAALYCVNGIHNSLGRVETPTLAMICDRFIEHDNFIKTKFWQLKMTIQKGDRFCNFSAVETISDKEIANNSFNKLKTFNQAQITKAECKWSSQEPPLLYDLSTLQKEANLYHNFTAQQTLDIAQKLYEKKLISYPKTDSRYIPEEMFAQITSLIKRIKYPPEFVTYVERLDLGCLNPISVCTAKMTNYHAIIPTGINPIFLIPEERIIFNMIVGRMLETVSPRCEKEIYLTEACCNNMLFRSKAIAIYLKGWRDLYKRIEDREDGEQQIPIFDFVQDEMVDIGSYNQIERQTMPKPLYTEATLLEAMENVVKDSGMGIPATRADIINSLFTSEYIDYYDNHILPTEKGMLVYNTIRNMRIADAELTGSWEQSLQRIQKEGDFRNTFMQAFQIFIRQVTDEILTLKSPKGDRKMDVPKHKIKRVVTGKKRC